MSLDISLEIPTGDSECAVYNANYTSNVWGMWDTAFNTDNFKDVLDGKKAREVIREIDTAIKNMQDNPEIYKAMNPDNGWGSYEGALKFLVDLSDACKEHYATTIRFS